jgi:ubiquinone/menaquinone biosynthesis C-methylase UbiE
MGFHTYDPDRADALEDPTRFRYCSREELLEGLGIEGESAAVVADLGSGTGFYTDELAPYVERLYAVDVQVEMHDRYREKGVPETVSLVTAEVADLPFDDGALDGAFSTMTYHEFASDDALTELRRVLGPDAPLVTVDWSAAGEGARGPPTDQRYDRDRAVDHHEAAGFDVCRAAERPETFVLVGTPG